MIRGSSSGAHAAQNTVSGITSNGVTWYETIKLVDENGDQLTGVSSDTWQFQFREDQADTSAALTLSTADGTLTITEGVSETTMLINVPQSSLAALDGDYIADLVSETSGGRSTHRAHGVVVFRNEPIAI